MSVRRNSRPQRQQLPRTARVPELKVRLNHPTDFSAAASGRRYAFDVIAGIAALVGLSLLVFGLAEHPATGRVAIELALTAPLVISIGWNLLTKAGRNWRSNSSTKSSPLTDGS